MIVWRVTRAVHAALNGEGARRAGGRWNPKGVAMVYTSAHLSLAVLELLLHVDPDTLPDDVIAAQIEIPERIRIEVLPEDTLPATWRTVPPTSATQRIGAAWIEARATRAGVLSVPSGLITSERNFLLNPHHPDARGWRVIHSEPFAFDPRLVGIRR